MFVFEVNFCDFDAMTTVFSGEIVLILSPRMDPDPINGTPVAPTVVDQTAWSEVVSFIPEKQLNYKKCRHFRNYNSNLNI